MFKLGSPMADRASQVQNADSAKGSIWADPHVVRSDNDKDFVVFFEEYLYRRKKGHISAFTISQDGRYTQPCKVLERPYHLSYPFVFKWDGDHYMIPESSENRTIENLQMHSFS